MSSIAPVITRRILRSSLSTPIFKPAPFSSVLTRRPFSDVKKPAEEAPETEAPTTEATAEAAQNGEKRSVEEIKAAGMSALVGKLAELRKELSEVNKKYSELEKKHNEVLAEKEELLNFKNVEFQKLKKDAEERQSRYRAEVESLQKIAQRDVDNAKKFGIQTFAKDLLPSCDNLKRALECVPREKIEASEDLKALHEGIEMTKDVLFKTCEKYGLVEINPQGEKFDPATMEALTRIPTQDEAQIGNVGVVMETGYILNERVIRPARVGVFYKQ